VLCTLFACTLPVILSNATKNQLSAKITESTVENRAIKNDYDTMKLDVKALKLEHYEELQIKLNVMDGLIKGVAIDIEKTRAEQKDFKNKWSVKLGRMNKLLELADQESIEADDNNDNIPHSELEKARMLSEGMVPPVEEQEQRTSKVTRFKSRIKRRAM